MIAVQIHVKMEESVQITVQTIILANVQKDSQAKIVVWMLMIVFPTLVCMANVSIALDRSPVTVVELISKVHTVRWKKHVK